jgi:hypothetical protein
MLDVTNHSIILVYARRSDGRLSQWGNSRGEESPGSMETRCRLTAGEGNLRESATESKPPFEFSSNGKGERVR